MSAKKKLVLFDIDYTLFNTDMYRRTLYPRLASELQIDESEFHSLAKEAEKNIKTQFGYFSPEQFLLKFSQASKGKVSITRLEELFWDEKLYEEALDKESRELFTRLQEKGVQICLLSTGDTRHQKAKVRSLISFINEEGYHIFQDKLSSLKTVLEMYSTFQLYIVDDLPEVLKKAKEIDPTIKTIWMSGKKIFEEQVLASNFRPDWTIKNIKEIYRIVSES